MKQAFFIADLHLSHRNILKYSNKERPFDTLEEHDQYIIDTINETVNKNDTLYILGDLAFGKDALNYVRQLKVQNKVLVLGNHDKYPMVYYNAVGFNKIYGMLRYKEFILTHAPIHPCQLEKRYSANIHGHLHTYDVDDPRYFNVNIDRLGFKPVSTAVIRDTIKYRLQYENT